MATKTKQSKITVKILDSSGQTSDLDISAYFPSRDLTNVKPNFIHQVLHSYLNNQRQATAKTKTRSEVQGGGRKPWRQKGTGRARHGTIRSPLWRTGGVVFGPTGTQNFKQSIPRKMKQKALRLAILDCLQKNSLIVIEKFPDKIESTKQMRMFLETLPIKYNDLIIFSPETLSLSRFAANLETVRTRPDSLVNALDIYQAQTVILTKQTLENILKRINPGLANTAEKPASPDKTKSKSDNDKKTAKKAKQ